MILDDYKEHLNKRKGRKLTFEKSFAYWRNILFEKCMRIFVWKGLPDTIPQKEIEMRLMIAGFCGVVLDGQKKGIATWGSMAGVTNYADEFTTYTFATPKTSGVRKINVNSVVINNNATRNALYPLIERYSFLLAHADLSLQAVLINSRATGIIAVKNQQQADDVKAWYNSLVDGSMLAIVDDENLNSLVNAQGLRNVSTQFPSSNSIADYYTIIQNLVKSFFNDIGVRASTEKRERLISDEVNSDETMLMFNLADMLDSRKKACDDLAKVFGWNDITVELAEEFNYTNVAVAQQKENEVKTNEEIN